MYIEGHDTQETSFLAILRLCMTLEGSVVAS